jgi:hypothetical protein
VTIPNVCRNGLSARRLIFYLAILLVLSPVSPSLFPAGYAAPASKKTTKKLKPTDAYALIFGTVWGPDERPVYGVTVKIRRVPDKKPKWQLYSDHAGEFAQRVPAGTADYVVWADVKGMKTADGHALHLAQEVTIHVEYDERVDMSLHLIK